MSLDYKDAPVELKLYGFQERAVEFLLFSKRAVLGSEMGLGKTATGIIASARLVERLYSLPNQGKRITFVVCPAFLRETWKKELALWLPNASVEVMEKMADVPSSSEWIIMSYEYATRNLSTLVKNLAPAVVICDESDYLKSPSSQRSRKIFPSLKSIPYVWLFTGTPLPNAVIDAYAPFNFCMNGALGSYYSFAFRYCNVVRQKYGSRTFTKITGGKNLEELRQRINGVFYRDTVDRVLHELPSFQTSTIYVPKSAAAKKLCKESNPFADEIEHSIEHGTENPSPIVATFRRQLAAQKAKDGLDIIENLIGHGRPVVIFGHHREALGKLSTALSENHTTALIDGDTPQSNRSDYVQRFQNGKIDVLVCSIKAAGLGITLTASSVCIFLEETYVPAERTQAMARIRRIGQKKFCNYYFLMYQDSIDESVHRAVNKKQAVIEEFLK